MGVAHPFLFVNNLSLCLYLGRLFQFLLPLLPSFFCYLIRIHYFPLQDNYGTDTQIMRICANFEEFLVNSPTLDVFQADAKTIKWVTFIANVLFNDHPFRTSFFTGIENGWPVEVPFANFCESLSMTLYCHIFEMNE